ncbi:hypothetical protein AB0J74_31660 [Asanoa sp. NPDC049573]|uniref:hypothetical protein n=1 Tax=Asanoa sp. NPDC049573 TaxID=3155396 RepID=UPI00341E8A8D
MRIHARFRRRTLAAAVIVAVVGQLALFAGEASAEETSRWQDDVAKIPTTAYTRDARQSITEAIDGVRPYLGDGLGDSRVDAVAADVANRYFDGARFRGASDGSAAFDNLKHLASYLKSRLSGASAPNGEAEQAHATALVRILTAIRLLSDAAIQDAEATIGPFRANPPPAPAPPGLSGAFGDLDAARSGLDKADTMLEKANPTPATVHAEKAWSDGFNVLTRLGITYDGDHDSDGVIDGLELVFGASPLLVDSDSDGLTDKFEITKLAGFTMPGRLDTDNDGVPDGAEDVDGDGLTNLREQELGTSPTEADTDGDGVSDGAEVDRGTNPLVPDAPPPPVTGTAPPIVPVPTDTDTDGDGLPDFTEEDDWETDPLRVDTDGDGLSDGVEALDYQIDPLRADTDGDGRDDAYEIAHIEDQGLDPTVPDEIVSKWTYVSDFLLGFFAGDFSPRDSMAWLSGYLCSGGLSFVPVVGWILGGLADLRDTIAGVIHQDWVGAGLSIIGLIPYGGDAVAIPGKAAKFALRYLHRLDSTIRFVAKWDKIPDSVKRLTIRAIMLGNYATLSSRMSEEVILRLARMPRMSLPRLADALSSANHVAGAVPTPFLRNAPDGEDFVAGLLSGTVFRNQQGRIPMPNMPRPGSAREPDDLVETVEGYFLHEVKTGLPGHPDTYLKQCEQDGHLNRNRPVVAPGRPPRAAKQIIGVLWHFVPKQWPVDHPIFSQSDGLGPPQDLLDCLKRNNIPFTIHPAI